MKRLGKLRYLFLLALLPLLWWALRLVPFQETWQTLSQLTPVQIAALLAVNLLIFFLFTSRWWLILRAQGHHLSMLSMVSYRLAGFGISYFTPGTQFGGEPLQVHLTHSRHAVPAPTALAAVTLDKVFELFANYAFLGIGAVLILNGGLSGAASGGARLLPAWALAPIFGLLCLPVAFLIALWSGRRPLTSAVGWANRLLGRLPGRLPGSLPGSKRLERLPPLITSAETQISALFRRRPLVILWALASSGLIWIMLIAEYWLMLALLGAHLTAMQAVLAMAAARLSFLIPIPGGLGVLEASQTLALGALGFSPAIGLSVALLIRARDISFGLLGLWLGAMLARRAPLRVSQSQAAD